MHKTRNNSQNYGFDGVFPETKAFFYRYPLSMIQLWEQTTFIMFWADVVGDVETRTGQLIAVYNETKPRPLLKMPTEATVV